MSDKKISQLNELLTAAIGDLIPIVDVSTNETKFIQKQNLTEIPSQTVTNGVTTKSPSEDAVFDAIEIAKGFVKDAVNKIAGQTLEVDKINLVNIGTDTTFTLPSASLTYKGKVLIVKLDNNPNFNLIINGSAHGTVILTKFRDSVIFSCVDTNGTGDYFWFDVSQSLDISTKLDLDGGNANQDIDIDGFGVNAKHFKVNGTAGAGHIGLKHQSANISASASESSIGADSVGDPVWKNDGGAIDKLELQSNKTGTVTGNEASTSKYLTVKGVYDWAVGLFAPKASPTFTGTVTTPDIIVSGATASTIAHFDGTKNIESLPLATYPSLTELSYVKGVTSAIQTQLNDKLSGSGLTTNKLLTWNGSSLSSVAGMQLDATWGQMFGYQGTVGSSGNIFSVFNTSSSLYLLVMKNDGSSAIMQSSKHTFGGTSIGAGVIIFDKNNAFGNLVTIQAVNTTSTNYIQGWLNNAQSYYGFRYSNTLVALWQANDNTASTILQKWSNASNSQIGVLQNDGLYLGSGTKSASASIQIDSTTQGFLPPRMTNTQRTNIVSPAIGLMVYCTDSIEGLYIYKSTGWTFII